MFSFLKHEEKPEAISCEPNEFVALATGKIIDITTVSDAMFAEKMLGESIAFDFDGSDVVLCAPCSGELTAVFPTGHAFGLSMENGEEVLASIDNDDEFEEVSRFFTERMENFFDCDDDIYAD